jgi:hypothetical protein
MPAITRKMQDGRFPLPFGIRPFNIADLPHSVGGRGPTGPVPIWPTQMAPTYPIQGTPPPGVSGRMLGEGTICVVDFEAEHVSLVSGRGADGSQGQYRHPVVARPIDAGVLIPGVGATRVLWEVGATSDLDAIQRSGADVGALRRDCAALGLGDAEARAAFRAAVPEDAVILHLGAGIDIDCLRYCYSDVGRRDLRVCDAANYLPRVFRGMSTKGRPIYEMMSLANRAAGLGLQIGKLHHSVSDAELLWEVVRRTPGYLAWPAAMLRVGGD